jgi:peroxiredoxin
MPLDSVKTAEQPVGDVLPDFELAPVADPTSTWRLHDRAARGSGALVIFWSAVCSHCVRYDAYFNSLATRHPDVAFAAIASRQSESADDIGAAITSRGLTFPILHDPERHVAHRLFARQTPRVYLVDRTARLLYRGAVDNFKYPDDSEYEAYLEPALASLAEGRAVGRPETASFGCAIETVYYVIPKPLTLGSRRNS